MKFGKEFQQILDDSKFPDDWKSSAIEYRQLKKIIKDVVSELSSMGLSPDVLHRLLTAEDDSSGPSTPPSRSGSPAAYAAAGPSSLRSTEAPSLGQVGQQSVPPSHVHLQHEGNDDVLEFEFESDESPPTFGSGSGLSGFIGTGNGSNGTGSAPGMHIASLASGRRTGRDSVEDLDEGNEGDHEGGRGKDEDAFGTSYTSSDGGMNGEGGGPGRRNSSFSRTRNFRVRLLSDANGNNASTTDDRLSSLAFEGPSQVQQHGMHPHARSRTEPSPIRPVGVADMIRSHGGDQEDLAGSLGTRPGTQRASSAEDPHWGLRPQVSNGSSYTHGHGHRRTVRRSMNEGGVRAQYVFAGDSSHPEPQLRFHLPPPSSQSPPTSRSASSSNPSDSVTTDDDDDDHADDMEDLTTLPIPAPVPLRPDRRPGSLANSPSTIKAGYKSPFLAAVPAISVSSPSIPASPTLQRLNLVKSPIFALTSGGGSASGSGSGSGGFGGWGSPKVDGLRDLSLGEAAVGDLDEPGSSQGAVVRGRESVTLTLHEPGAVRSEDQECTASCPAHPDAVARSQTPGAIPTSSQHTSHMVPSIPTSPGAPVTDIAASGIRARTGPSAASEQHNHALSAAHISGDGIDNEHGHGHGNGRDIIVPLTSDRAFFDLLTAALTSLSVFHAAQQEAFRAAVEKLCVMISNSIVPQGSSVQIMPIPPVPGGGSGTSSSAVTLRDRSQVPLTTHGIQRPPQELLARRITKLHKKDLYAWREIFTLWIEAEIFESSAERTRGERTVEEAEQRLQAFANEVVKRGLGDRRTFRGKKTREAWEEFLRLNVLLLDLKRFQLANINAARKILKKHDKRTALTASTGFQSLARATLSKIGADGSVSTWTFYNTSLPHVLLASLTDILLPILPSLDDYACLICTSIAFKPIRLSCQHLFCVRCLVKMQRKGQAECPLCRSPTVLLADKYVQIMDFMRDWFPREVKAKQRENDEEIADEIRAEEGGESADCVVM